MKGKTYTEIAKVAGQLYGSILQRAADKSGYEFIIEELTSGNSTLPEIVIHMMTSDEFRETFVMNQTPNELAKQLRQCLLKEMRVNNEMIKTTAINILEQDWRSVVTDMVNSSMYRKAFGDDKVPTFKVGG